MEAVLLEVVPVLPELVRWQEAEPAVVMVQVVQTMAVLMAVERLKDSGIFAYGVLQGEQGAKLRWLVMVTVKRVERLGRLS